MLFLTDKIKLINQQLTFEGFRFTGKWLINEVAKTAVVDNEGRVETMPVISVNNDYKFIGIDDTYPLIIYHKHLGTSYADVDIDERRETNRMRMIVFGKLEPLNLTAEELGAYVVSLFPSEIKKKDYQLPINIEGVTLNDVNADSESVFNTEYRNTSFVLSANMALLQFSYTIESTYIKGCFDPCAECGKN